jgi:hypothetical protein
VCIGLLLAVFCLCCLWVRRLGEEKYWIRGSEQKESGDIAEELRKIEELIEREERG